MVPEDIVAGQAVAILRWWVAVVDERLPESLVAAVVVVVVVCQARVDDRPC